MMATDFKLDEYGDILIENGDIALVDGSEEIAQLAETKILKVYDEDLLALETGIDWFTKMFDVETENSLRELLVKSAIVEIPEVTSVSGIKSHLDPETGVLTFDEIQIDSTLSAAPIVVGP